MSDAVIESRKLVRDLMKVGVLTVPLTGPVPDVARLILEKDLEGVVVLDEEGHGVGVITRDDLVCAYCREDVRGLTAEAIMSEGVPQLPPDIPLTAAAKMMHDNHWRVVFLMHNAGGIIYPAASLSYTHLIRHLAARDQADLKDLGIAAARRAPLDIFIEKRDAAKREAGKHRY